MVDFSERLKQWLLLSEHICRIHISITFNYFVSVECSYWDPGDEFPHPRAPITVVDK